MISAAQTSRLHSIARDCFVAKNHPSEHVRKSVADFTEEEIKQSIDFIEKVVKGEDGMLARTLISRWHEGGEKWVLMWIKENAKFHQI